MADEIKRAQQAEYEQAATANQATSQTFDAVSQALNELVPEAFDAIRQFRLKPEREAFAAKTLGITRWTRGFVFHRIAYGVSVGVSPSGRWCYLDSRHNHELSLHKAREHFLKVAAVRGAAALPISAVREHIRSKLKSDVEGLAKRQGKL